MSAVLTCEGCAHAAMGAAPECRRFPPVIVALPVQNALKQVALAPQAMFPPAQARCGEWKNSGREVLT